ncbi:MAG: hypothetical protein V2I65_08025 [Paracoccaceae bacterium]|nr:hypothetical protein [Paracoccaceae bacterium]
MSSVFINEFHYDNVGTDTGEFIEIAGPAGTDLAGYSLVLYNGVSSLRSPYDTLALSGVLGDDAGPGYGFAAFSFTQIQNGAPDGFALLDPSDTVLQFLSYEGGFMAASGPAQGLTSTDVGVAEDGTTPVGQSLQLGGTGNTYADFTWQSALAQTPGAPNVNQTFESPEVVPLPAALPLLLAGLVALRTLARSRSAG